MPRPAPGTLCWVDLGTRDPVAAARFYTELFGWEVDEPDGLGYRLCRLDGRLVAGLADHPDAELPWWSTNVTVADVDEAARRIEALGGAVTSGPGRFGDYGRWVAATDPSETKVLLFEHLEAEAVELRDAPNTWTHSELVTSAPPEDVSPFYEGMFGWRTTASTPAAWTLDGRPVATIARPPAGWPGSRPSLWVTWFAVDDVATAVDRASALGGSSAVWIDADAALVLDDQSALVGLRRSHTPSLD